MGKVVILGGNARSGKTTLAINLVKHGFSRISFDNIHEIVRTTFNKEINELSKEKQFELFENIVNLSIEESINEDTNIVIDMYDYLPKCIDKLARKKEVEVYFLAYPNCTKEEIKYNVIHYAKKTDWIVKVNEKYLNECIERFYDRNKLLIEECSKYNCTLIDTSSGKKRNEVLNNLLNKIIR